MGDEGGGRKEEKTLAERTREIGLELKSGERVQGGHREQKAAVIGNGRGMARCQPFFSTG
jgi:hypothetical protein